MSEFGAALVQAGLVQFGWYTPDDAPYRFHLQMLPSYPDILRLFVDAGAAAARGADRLLAAADAVPFGVALSLATGVPLVYSQGAAAAAVHDLIGAYDIGHPALLVTNHLDDWDSAAALAAEARQVGLAVHSVLALAIGRTPPAVDGLQVTGLVHLDDLVRRLAEQGELPAQHARAVLNWLQTHDE